MHWKILLKKHDKLVARGNCNLFDRMILLKQVHDDPEFSKEMLSQGKRPVDVLSDILRDTCANFTELVQMIKLYPERKQWEKGSVSSMREETLKTVKSRLNAATEKEKSDEEKQSDKATKDGRKLSWKEKYLELEARYRVLEGKYQQIEQDYREFQNAINKKSVA